MDIKQFFISLFQELFDKGEILKAQILTNKCTPLDIKNDPQILALKEKVNSHIEQIRGWNIIGRPYPGTYATVDFNSFPKFVLAQERILERYKNGALLDIGCYSGVFINEMINLGFYCHGIDVHKELMKVLQDKYNDGRSNFGCVEHILYGDHSFDIVTAFDVLEHIIDLDKSLLEIERVCKSGGLIIINLPRMTLGYKEESHEHMRMFDDEDINRIWGNKRDFTFEFCKDEHGNPTSFITYLND